MKKLLVNYIVNTPVNSRFSSNLDTVFDPQIRCCGRWYDFKEKLRTAAPDEKVSLAVEFAESLVESELKGGDM